MRSKQFLGFLLTIFLIATIQPSQAVSLDQEPVTFVLKDKSFTSSGTVLKGVNESSVHSRFELITSSVVNTRDVVRLFGSPTIDQTSDEISVNGTLNGYNTHSLAYRNSFLQKDSYFEGIAVDERIVRSDRIFRDNQYSLDVERIFTLNMTYDDIDNDGNFTKIVDAEHQVDIFVLRYFNARLVTVNDSDGNILGRVYGFNIFISIHVFDSNTHEYVAYHGIHDFGFGNMLPDRVNEYLGKLSQETTSRNSDRIVNDTRPGPLSKISWFDLGYNETLELNMLYGFYNLERNSRTIVLPRTTTTNLSLNSLKLSQDTSLELLIDDISMDQQLSGFEDDNLESLDNEFIEVTLAEDGVSIEDAFVVENSSEISTDDPTSEEETESDAPFNMYYFLVPLVLIPFFRKRTIQK